MLFVRPGGCLAGRRNPRHGAGETRQCEIRGGIFPGISAYLDKGETVKVLVVHGIGTHRPGHSAVISEGIAHSLGLSVFSNPADADILNPRDPSQRLANLRTTRMRNPEGSRRLILYELTWSDITAARKRVLDFDTSGEYAHRRASFNNIMKGFLNDVGPDAMIYVADRENLILAAAQQAVCWMLAGDERGRHPARGGLRAFLGIAAEQPGAAKHPLHHPQPGQPHHHGRPGGDHRDPDRHSHRVRPSRPRRRPAARKR